MSFDADFAQRALRSEPRSPLRRCLTPPGTATRSVLNGGDGNTAASRHHHLAHAATTSLHLLRKTTKALRLPSAHPTYDSSSSVRLDSPLAGTYRPLPLPTSPSHVVNSVRLASTTTGSAAGDPQVTTPGEDVDGSDGEEVETETASSAEKLPKEGKRKRGRSKERKLIKLSSAAAVAAEEDGHPPQHFGHGRRRSWAGWRLRIGQRAPGHANDSHLAAAGSAESEQHASNISSTKRLRAVSPHAAISGDLLAVSPSHSHSRTHSSMSSMASLSPRPRKTSHWQRWRRPELAALLGAHDAVSGGSRKVEETSDWLEGDKASPRFPKLTARSFSVSNVSREFQL